MTQDQQDLTVYKLRTNYVAQGYIEAMLFAETFWVGDESEPDELDGQPLNEVYGVFDLPAEVALACMLACDAFFAYPGCMDAYGAMLDKASAEPYRVAALDRRIGADVYFTRQGHGVGFWEADRWPEVEGSIFDAAAKELGEFNLSAWRDPSGDGGVSLEIQDSAAVAWGKSVQQYGTRGAALVYAAARVGLRR